MACKTSKPAKKSTATKKSATKPAAKKSTGRKPASNGKKPSATTRKTTAKPSGKKATKSVQTKARKSATKVATKVPKTADYNEPYMTPRKATATTVRRHAATQDLISNGSTIGEKTRKGIKTTKKAIKKGAKYGATHLILDSNGNPLGSKGAKESFRKSPGVRAANKVAKTYNNAVDKTYTAISNDVAKKKPRKTVGRAGVGKRPTTSKSSSKIK